MIGTLIVLALAACNAQDTHGGTAVGNLDATLRFATPTAADITTYAGELRAMDLSLLGCDLSVVRLAADLDLRLDSSSTLNIPTGTWCGVRLTPSGPAHWAATSSPDFMIDLTLDLGVLSLRSPSPVDFAAGDAYIWALGDHPWLDAAALGADEDDIIITPEDDRHDALVATIRRDQAFLRDRNDDGERDEDDDLIGEPEDDEDDD